MAQQQCLQLDLLSRTQSRGSLANARWGPGILAVRAVVPVQPIVRGLITYTLDPLMRGRVKMRRKSFNLYPNPKPITILRYVRVLNQN